MRRLWPLVLSSFISTFLPAAFLWGVASRSSENAYIDPNVCASCHLGQHEGYQNTGMARSLSPAGPFLSRILGEKTATFYHQPSDRHYTVFRRGDQYFLRRHQMRGENKINQLERRIDLVIGSGNHAATLVHRSEQGKLLELPLTWYSASGGYFAMSPGYDNPNHFGFRRQITDKCRSCHSAYPQVPTGSDVAPIDCQRCHGPGQRHLDSISADAGIDAIRQSIVNPARLTPARALETCLQCHLETTSRPLPDSLLRHPREIFSFRPGDPLGDFRIYFDHPNDHPLAEKFEVNSAGYRFLKSSCFRASQGEFQCISCHNPHRHLRGEEMGAKTRAVCLSCHQEALSSVAAHTLDSDCVSCHMPKRRSEDAVHVMVTDHSIPRLLPDSDPFHPQDELENARRAVYRGPVVPFYPPDFPSSPEDRLYLALAQIKDDANLASGVAALQAAVEQLETKNGYYYFELAKALLKTGHQHKAMRALEKSLNLNPNDQAACQVLGEVLLQRGELEKAIQRLESCRQNQPVDAALETTLAVAYGQRGELEKAIAVLEHVIQKDPDRVSARMNLGTALERKGESHAAKEQYREVIRIQPDSGLAHFYLANVLLSTGEEQEAAYYLQKAGDLNPELRERSRQALQELKRSQ